jgi:hypothetical protein
MICENHLAMKHDTAEDIAARENNKDDFVVEVQEARRKTHHPSVRDPEEEDTREMDNTWRRSTSREGLVERFALYLSKKSAKSSATHLKDETQRHYLQAVFGVRNSFEKALKETRGEGFEVHHLMFRPDNNYVPMDIQIVEEFVRVKENRSASTCSLGVIAVRQLCVYIVRAAPLDPGFIRTNNDHQLAYMNFKDHMRTIMDLLTEKASILSKTSALEAEAKKEAAQRRDPERDAAQVKAIRDYYGCPHFQERLVRLNKLAEAAEEGEPIDIEDLVDCGRWLMLMVNYFNGARRQAATLVKNKHVIRKQRATTISDEIQLENKALDLQDVASLTINGNIRGDGDGGKTGRIELALPKNLNDAVVNYMAVKKAWMGKLDPEAAFFVNERGEKIKKESLYMSNAAKGVFSEMGYVVTMTANRAFVATIQRELDLKGEMFTVSVGSSIV